MKEHLHKYRISRDRLGIWNAAISPLAGGGVGWTHAFQTKDNNIANTRPETTPAIRSTDYKEPIALVITKQGGF